MTTKRPVILTFCDYYSPGFKAGGPITTVAGLVNHLSDEFDFKLLTRDRDLGESQTYPGVRSGEWRRVGAADLMYLDPGGLNMMNLRRVIRESECDLLYFNSFFSRHFTIEPLLLRRFGRIQPVGAVIGPRGELARSALALKAFKKSAFIQAAKVSKLVEDVVWQASGWHEAQDIRQQFGNRVRVFTAPDLVSSGPDCITRKAPKLRGELDLLFLSRLSPMKNLEGALAILKRIEGIVRFDIYGPIGDDEYWTRCQRRISELPSNITATYRGPVEPTRVGAVLQEYDLLFLPTLGEAFGHVIIESLVCGRPVLISDRTRWRGLEGAGVGWDIGLDDEDGFVAALRTCVEMEEDAWLQMSAKARAFGLGYAADPGAEAANRTLFRSALRTAQRRQGT